MTKRKLQRFAETATFPNFFQPGFDEITTGYRFRSCWNTKHFENTNPLVLELGCGKGEYAVGLARQFPANNYIGIDIKGARMWRGAKTAIEEKLSNVAFLRTHIYYLDSFFGPEEVSAIWITFPDPQPQRSGINKRLTSLRYLEIYRNFLKSDGLIHLKTDDDGLFDFTCEVVANAAHPIDFCTDDLYAQAPAEVAASIQTFYEQMWLEEGKKIKYIRFRLKAND